MQGPSARERRAGPRAPDRADDWAALEASLRYPAHQEVAKLIGELRVERRFVDFEARARYAGTMCLICVDFDRGALKVREARRALGEMRSTLDAEHLQEVEKKLADAEREAPDATD
jgi:hypothetical protein